MEHPSKTLAASIARTLKQSGHQVYFVGGCVRDRLLGRPVNDYDLTTDATPERLAALFPRALQVGAHVGVMLVRRDGGEAQVATFRSDHAYSDGRRPGQVTFERDARQDVLRRDFTINALLEDPFTGEVIDHVGGLADLRAGLIRAIGGAALRFEEDHLRLLRALRFAARLGFAIEPVTFEAVRKLAGRVHRVSAERIRDEIARILIEGGARRGFELLDESGLLVEVLPEVARMKGVPQPPQYHPEGDVWTHTLLLLGHLPPDPPLELALAALLHDVAKPVTMTVADRIRFNGHAEEGARMTREILGRLRFPGAVIDTVVSLVLNHMRFIQIPKMGTAALKRFFRAPHFDQQMELYRLDLLGSMRALEGYEWVRAKRDALAEHDLRPPRLLTGEDLIEMGYVPGPRFSAILSAVEDAQLEGRVSTREDALILVRRDFPPDER